MFYEARDIELSSVILNYRLLRHVEVMLLANLTMHVMVYLLLNESVKSLVHSFVLCTLSDRDTELDDEIEISRTDCS